MPEVIKFGSCTGKAPEQGQGWERTTVCVLVTRTDCLRAGTSESIARFVQFLWRQNHL